MSRLLLLSIVIYCFLNLSFINGFTRFPRFASKLSTQTSSALSSSLPTSHAADTRKKRRTRFHYSKKNVPPTLQKQKSLARGNQPLVSLNLNLDSLAKSGAAPRAQELLHRISALHKEGYYATAPDVVSYNSVLNAWALSTKEPVERAVELFSQQVQSHIRPTLVTYNTLILAFSKRGQAEDAQHVLKFLLEQGGDIRPDTISFNSVLHAWAVQGNGKQAENLLKQMIQLSVEGHANIKPDTISFNTVLHAYRKNPQRASLLLQHMERLFQAGNDDVEPDVYSYTSVIRAWARRHSDGAKHAMELLQTMERLSHERALVAPNTVTYSCVMQALATSRQAGSAQLAQDILQRMLDRYTTTVDPKVKPDVVIFTNVINAWARDSSPHSAQRALELLEQMKRHDVKPNQLTYTSVFRALAKRGVCNAAEKLLGKLSQPSTIHYNCVLDAHAKSQYWNKAHRAFSFLEEEMENNPNVHPDIISYNSVLAACANTYGRDKNRALKVCVSVFKRKLVLQKATPVTYFLLFKAISKLLSDKDARKWSLIQQGFKLCCDGGLLSERVLSGVKRACTADQYSSLLPKDEKDGKEHVVRYSKLPSKWKRNAREKR